MSFDPTSCSICQNQYDSRHYIPFSGSCGHSLCKNCVEQLENPRGYTDEKYKCPFCSEISFGNAKPNRLAIELLSLIDQEKDRIILAMKGFDEVFSAVPYADPTVNSFQSANQAQTSNRTTTAIHVRNIPSWWNSEDLRSCFQEFGRIMSSTFGNAQNENRGMATIEFSKAEDVDKAISGMNDVLFDNIPLIVKKFEKPSGSGRKEKKRDIAQSQHPELFKAISSVAQKRVDRLLAKNLGVHLRNLGHVTEDQIRNGLSSDGKITEVRIVRDHYGQETGEAYVYFDKEEAVEKALKRDFTILPGTKTKITVDKIK